MSIFLNSIIGLPLLSVAIQEQDQRSTVPQRISLKQKKITKIQAEKKKKEETAQSVFE